MTSLTDFSPAATVTLRVMRLADIGAVLNLQAAAYTPDLLEDEATLRARWAQCPDTAWVACRAEQVCAYLVAYPSLLGALTPLGAHFAPAPSPDCLYLHDLAVSPALAGRGVGKQLVAHACSVAASAGWRYSALVAVQGSVRFWHGQGYRSVPPSALNALQHAHLKSYHVAAVYMQRHISG